MVFNPVVETSASSPQVSIEIEGGGARIKGCPSDIMQVIAEQRMFFAMTKGGQIAQHKAAVSMAGVDRDGDVCIVAGLVPRVVAALNRNGITYELVDRRQWDERLEVDPDVLDHDIDAEQMIRAVNRHSAGQLIMKSPKDAMPWMAAICRLYSRAKVLIMVGTLKRAWQIWRGLQEYLGSEVAFYKNKHFADIRVVVTTFRTLKLDADVILLPEPKQAIGDRASDIISLLGKRPNRVYAVLQPHDRFSDRQQLKLEALAGPVIFDARTRQVPAYVSMMDAYSAPAVDEGDALTWKRTAYWRNDRRNDAIAAIGTGAAAGDMAAFWQAGMLLDENEAYLANIKPSDVSILVESTEHGQELLSRLPGWLLRHLRPKESTAASAGGIQGPAGEIVTVAYAARHGVQAGILIRADGGDSPMAIKGFPVNEGATPLDSALVIDIKDSFCRGARRDTRRRIQHYRRVGWQVDGDQEQNSNRTPQTFLPGVPAGDRAK